MDHVRKEFPCTFSGDRVSQISLARLPSDLLIALEASTAGTCGPLDAVLETLGEKFTCGSGEDSSATPLNETLWGAKKADDPQMLGLSTPRARRWLKIFMEGNWLAGRSLDSFSEVSVDVSA
jgi:hypothetical protein